MKPLGNVSILVVDDEADLRDAIKDELVFAGATVYEAPNGTIAFDMLSKRHIDAIISDMRMPGGDGLTLLKNIKAMAAVTPVVLLISGYSDLPASEAYHIGAEAIFPKPFDTDALVASVKRLLTPLDRRLLWESSHDPNMQTITFHTKSLQEALEARTLNIGRGGFSISTQTEAQFGQTVRFDISTDDANGVHIRGEGIVRWKRPCMRDPARVGMKVGLGIEFLSTDPSSAALIVEHLSKAPTKAYIPVE